ncbi:MAG: hypothetical protein MI724_11940, partial [Spirochaetales bacterium]|nr:hypothetical protein [Spirochaetales bacterium]
MIYPTPEELDHRLQPREWDGEEGTLIIEAALKNDGPGRNPYGLLLGHASGPGRTLCVLLGHASGVEVGGPPQRVSERRVHDDHAGKQRSHCRLSVELIDDTVDQSGDIGEEAAIVTEERPTRFRDGEHELSMRQVAQNLIGQMLGEQDGPFSTAGGTEGKPLA